MADIIVASRYRTEYSSSEKLDSPSPTPLCTVLLLIDIIYSLYVYFRCFDFEYQCHHIYWTEYILVNLDCVSNFLTVFNCCYKAVFIIR